MEETPSYIEVYSYNNEGIYVGITVADKSPLENGIYLIPANATTIKPPEIQEGYIQKFNGTGWDVVEIINKKYLLIDLSNRKFGFNNEIIDGYICKEISMEDFNNLVNLQSQGKQFRLKDTITGEETFTNLFDYVEEYFPASIVALKEEIVRLKETIAEIVESSNTNSTNTKEGVTDLNEMVDTSTN